MNKDTGIVIRQWHAVDYIHFSKGVEKECVINIVQNSMEISIIWDLQIGIAMSPNVQIDFIKHKRNVV